jgi:hypothetical protein
MFESTLITFLQNDNILAGYVSQYNSKAAIFSDEAPEDAELPYIVLRITSSAGPDPSVQKFSIFIEYFDDNKSRVNSRAAASRTILLLDRKHLDHDRYATIRIYFFDGSPIEECDPRKIHYSLQFEARAGRKAFAEYQTTLETTTE